jgi:YesN/AraC family two-component response regulator
MKPSVILSILVVEDDEMALVLLTSAIELKYPHAMVYSANNGRNGLENYMKYSPDIIITDINMPKMDGIEMIREILAIKRDSPIIAITAYGDKTIREVTRQAGIIIHQYLLKPLDYGQLFEAIDNVLATGLSQVQ